MRTKTILIHCDDEVHKLLGEIFNATHVSDVASVESGNSARSNIANETLLKAIKGSTDLIFL